MDAALSSTIWAPLRWRDSSDARKRTVFATSSGWPRPGRVSAPTAASSGVLIIPGRIALQRIA